MKINDFSYIFIETQSIFIENQWKIMDFRDFPHILGKSGKYESHPPKFCPSLGEAHTARAAARELGDRWAARRGRVRRAPRERRRHQCVHPAVFMRIIVVHQNMIS